MIRALAFTVVACTIFANATFAQYDNISLTIDPDNVVLAQADTDHGMDASYATSMFAKDSWVINLFGGGYFDAFGNSDRDEVMGLAGLGIGYHVIDDLSLNAELYGAYVDRDPMAIDGGPDATGAFGFNLILRWHALKFDKFTFFIEGGAGLIVGIDEIPAHGTNFNFTPQFGLGVTYEIESDMLLVLGARYMHISNADIDEDRNPGLDTIGGYVGLMFRF